VLWGGPGVHTAFVRCARGGSSDYAVIKTSKASIPWGRGCQFFSLVYLYLLVSFEFIFNQYLKPEKIRHVNEEPCGVLTLYTYDV
jgi:hypothetical protein